MRQSTHAFLYAAPLLALLAGCASTTPVAPAISRLSPDQFAALRSIPLSDEQKQHLNEQNQQVLREQDEADARAAEALRQQQARSYVVDPGYAYPGYDGSYLGYRPGYVPFYPGLSLSLGYVWGRFDGPHRRWHGHR